EASRAERDRLAERFFTACRKGDATALAGLLSKDIVVYGDGGGKRPAATVPIQGDERGGRALLGFLKAAQQMGVTFTPAYVNGHPGGVFFDSAGAVVWVTSIDIADGTIRAVRSVLNPDKLTRVQVRRDG